jgi:hypothetical protein
MMCLTVINLEEEENNILSTTINKTDHMKLSPRFNLTFNFEDNNFQAHTVMIFVPNTQ